jgi:hypothetical protein
LSNFFQVVELFGWTVGEYVGDFSAAYYRVSGQFFVATKALLFYSNLLGFERRFCLALSDIDTIESHRTTSIKISMVDCEEYVFKKFQDRDAVVRLLQELLGRYKTAEKNDERMESIISSSSPIFTQQEHQQHYNSLPIGNESSMISTDVGEKAGSPDINNEEDSFFLRDDDFQRPHLSSDVTPDHANDWPSPGPNRIRSSSVPTVITHQSSSPALFQPASAKQKLENEQVRKTKLLQRSRTPLLNGNRAHSSQDLLQSRSEPISSGKIVRKSRTGSYDPGSRTLDDVAHEETDRISKQLFTETTTSATKTVVNDMAILSAWEKESKACHENIALEPTDLSCSLNEFFDLFFQDEAPHALAKYQQEHIGDKHVQFSPWRPLSSETGNNATVALIRTIEYIHPLNNSMGPSEAKTYRTQYLLRYGECGMLLRNITKVEGIPMADCFQVMDQWIFHPSGTRDDDRPCLTLSVSFQVDFVKRTMFKSLIQKNVKSETKKWFSGYVEVLRRVMEQRSQVTASTVAPGAKFDVDTDLADSAEIEIVREAETFEMPLARSTTITTLIQSTHDFLTSMDGDLLFKVLIIVLVVVLIFQITTVQKRLSIMEGHMLQIQKQVDTLLLTHKLDARG